MTGLTGPAVALGLAACAIAMVCAISAAGLFAVSVVRRGGPADDDAAPGLGCAILGAIWGLIAAACALLAGWKP